MQLQSKLSEQNKIVRKKVKDAVWAYIERKRFVKDYIMKKITDLNSSNERVMAYENKKML
jgi:hypothetical protein